MPEYVLRFAKEGYIKYTSHLDIMRLFQRAFKKADIKLRYSQGYNPHPKMGFAQPLSLGYSSDCELMEFETEEDLDPGYIKEKMSQVMGESLDITGCRHFPEGMKKLAASAVSAVYIITMPLGKDEKTEDKIDIKRFMDQKDIPAEKRQKKTKKMKTINIRPMIRKLDMFVKDTDEGRMLSLAAELDAGSQSNLSPELLITAFIKYFSLDIPREEIDVKRISIGFDNGFEF